MNYREVKPAEQLKSFVKCYFIMESSIGLDFADTIYPAGNIEMVFNLGESRWQSSINRSIQIDPPVELIGQLTSPMHIKTKGKTEMLGIRFYAFAASCFLDENLANLSNRVSDSRDISDPELISLYDKLLELSDMDIRIQHIEKYLFSLLKRNETRLKKFSLMSNLVNDMEKSEFSISVESLSQQYNISTRYLQRIFLEQVGITPKLYNRINRFQLSLKKINNGISSLTAAAYDCGYADQSHFIREFKSFTGLTPSEYSNKKMVV